MESGFRSTAKQVFACYKRNNNKRKTPVPFEISFEEFLDVIVRDCYICGAPPSNRYQGNRSRPFALIYNGVDRVVNSLGYIKGNVKPCCHRCNRVKSEMDLEPLKEHLQKMLEGLK